MGDEKYINKDMFGNIEFSDTPQYWGQQRFEIRDSITNPFAQEVYEQGRIFPSFDIETDALGNKRMVPHNPSYGGFSTYGTGKTRMSWKASTPLELFHDIVVIVVCGVIGAVASVIFALFFGWIFVSNDNVVGATDIAENGLNKTLPVLLIIVAAATLIAIVVAVGNYTPHKKE